MKKKWKSMQAEDKVFYVFMVFILFWFTVVILSSCASSIYQVRKTQITHVLAVTEMGDNLKIPLESIKPNVIYNVVGYDYMRYNPYYSPYNNRYYYNFRDNDPWVNRIMGNSGSGIQYNNISPTTQIFVPSSNNSGTSGFSGNPVASNPVTSGGGAKKNN